LGVKPYVILYNNDKGTYQHHMKRWIEWRYYQIMPWEKYDYGDSQKWIKSTIDTGTGGAPVAGGARTAGSHGTTNSAPNAEAS